MTVSRYNERDYAEKVLSGGFQSKNKQYELEILAKLFSSKGGTKKEVERDLKTFCEENEPSFSYAKEYYKIDRAINKGYSKEFVELTEIPITMGEIQAIKELNLDDTKSKILLAMMFKVKQSTLLKKIPYEETNWFFYGTNKKYSELKKISKISSRQNINAHIYQMTQLGILKAHLGGSVSLSFLENNPSLYNKETYISLKIVNYDQIGHIWEKLNGTYKIQQCVSCDKLMRKNSPSQKYCRDCAIVINREKTRLSVARKREKRENV